MKAILKKCAKAKFIRFCGVGIINTLINYSVFLLLLQLFYVNYLISGAIGFMTGAVCGFFLNKKLTFQVNVSNTKIINYLLVNLFGLLLNMLIQYIMVKLGHMPKASSQLFGIVITTLSNFFLSSYFVYTPRTWVKKV